MILLVDDEKRYLENNVEELEALGHEVILKRRVEEALEILEKRIDKVDAVIVDIMIPSGPFKESDTSNGLRTGIIMAQAIRLISSQVPIIFFTNVSDEDTAKKLAQPEGQWFLRKTDYFSHEFAAKVDKIIHSQRRSRPH